MKRLIFFIIVIGAIGGGAYYYLNNKSEADTGDTPPYQFAKIERKTVLNMVSATGTIAAKDEVEVSTQVSGRLTQIYVDFNHEVEAGQLVAQIDPAVLDASVKMEQADLKRFQAQLQQAKNKYDRFKPVYEEGFLSDNDFEPYEIQVQTAEANVLSAEAALDRALRNRSYAEIVAPISGVVIDRTVEPGQTVAANFNAPRLFSIAADLSEMEILANVDESDIGQIKVGQEVRFSVAAYTEKSFTGEVEEIRLSPKVIQNVVNYTVVVNADNPDGDLLPGMTATMDFVIEEVEDALSVPASALNLKQNDDMLAYMQKRRDEMRKRREANAGGEGGDGQRQRPGGGEGGVRQRPGGESGAGGFAGGGRTGGGSRARGGLLWYLDEKGELNTMMVRTGISDGIRTEILPLRDSEIPEGLEIITKVNSPSAAAQTQAQGPGGPGGGPGGPGGSGLRRLGF